MNNNSTDPAASGNQEGVAASEDRKPLDMDMSTDLMAKHENVSFEDANAGHADTRGAHVDPIRDHIMLQDATLDDFFSRPLKITEMQWTPGNSLGFRFNPWTLFFENSRVINRLVNYRLLRCTMKVKFVINGNSFYFGRALASYLPQHQEDEFTTRRYGSKTDLVGFTQRPHIYLNPTCCQGGELELPFFTPLNVLDITRSDWQTMGEIDVVSLNNLKHANGATDPITVSVFAWADNVRMAVPTQTAPTSLSPQSIFSKMSASDERKGIISKPASAVAKAAGTLKQIPVIEPFASATEMGAKAIGKLAALFGYSKPDSDASDMIVPVGKGSLAVCDGIEHLSRLTVDSKQELSIDPKIGGLEVDDELPILHYATRETYLDTFAWGLPNPPAFEPEALLWNSVVDPTLFQSATSGTSTNREVHLTALAYAALPFQYWKGSLRFRFQIVASEYHKGRLKVVYDPVTTPEEGTAEYNTAYTTIVDISETKDFTVDCGWGQPEPWRERQRISAATQNGTFRGATPLNYDSRTARYGNGTIAVYIVNDLTSPDSVIDNDIEVNVFVSALDDFEVAVPSDNDMKFLRVYDPNSIVPQSIFESAPYGAEKKGDMAAESPCDGILNKVYFGEAIGSFRQLLKRFNLHEVIPFQRDFEFPQNLDSFLFRRSIMPYDTGYTPNLVAANFAYTDANGDKWVHGFTPLISYIKWAHAGWRGGTRYHIDTSNMIHSTGDITNGEVANRNEYSWCIGRASMDEVMGIENVYVKGSFSDFTLIDHALDVHANVSGHGGVTRFNSRVNPQHTYEVPFYSNKRFLPGRKNTVFQPSRDEPKTQMSVTTPSVYGGQAFHALQYVSAAEDFTPLFYLGPPRLFLVTNKLS